MSSSLIESCAVFVKVSACRRSMTTLCITVRHPASCALDSYGVCRMSLRSPIQHVVMWPITSADSGSIPVIGVGPAYQSRCGRRNFRQNRWTPTKRRMRVLQVSVLRAYHPDIRRESVADFGCSVPYLIGPEFSSG